jgi:peptidoglycan/xylan/chitin deacetylase (PgdA/CDA1 family)
VGSASGGRVAAARRQALALVYHRIRPDPARDDEVVPCVPVEQFRAHVRALRSLGDVVPLDRLLPHERSERPRFALTFDDDYASHIAYVLPLLRELEVSGTFFLSGRSLHGLGPYWWQILEARLRRDGAVQVARALDVPVANPHAIALACENDLCRRHLLEAEAGNPTDQLDAGAIAALAEAGMTIGFHTLAHDVLPTLDPQDRRQALTLGRDPLERLTGQRVAMFAYPHGRADAPTAADARAVGYETAWTGSGRAISPRSDRWRLARWEPGPVDVSTLRSRAIARLLRTASRHG